MILAQPKARRRSVMSLTPLIDVVFILLLFFMLASNFSQERGVVLVSKTAGGSEESGLPVESSRIHLLAKERFTIDGIVMMPSNLLTELSTRVALNPLHSVVVSVGEDISVQSLLSFISSIKLLGVEKIVMDGSAAP